MSMRPKFPDGIIVNADRNPTMRGVFIQSMIVSVLLGVFVFLLVRFV